MSKEKSQGQLLKEKLCISKKRAGLRLTSDEIKTCFDFCGDYKAFLNDAKIEREAVTKTITLAEKCGFKEFTYGMSLKQVIRSISTPEERLLSLQLSEQSRLKRVFTSQRLISIPHALT